MKHLLYHDIQFIVNNNTSREVAPITCLMTNQQRKRMNISKSLGLFINYGLSFSNSKGVSTILIFGDECLLETGNLKGLCSGDMGERMKKNV